MAIRGLMAMALDWKLEGRAFELQPAPSRNRCPQKPMTIPTQIKKFQYIFTLQKSF